MIEDQSLAQLQTRSAYLAQLREKHRGLFPVDQFGALVEVADEITGADAYRTAQLVDSCLQRADRDPIRTMRLMRQSLPWATRQRIGDGSTIKVTLPVYERSSIGDQVSRYTVNPECRVLWEHQTHNPWRPTESSIGAVIAAQTAPVTGDLQLWIALRHDQEVEMALYGQLSASPGIDLAGHEAGWKDGQATRTWDTAHLAEISLCRRGDQAFSTVDVITAVAPADLVAAWARATAPAPTKAPEARTPAAVTRAVLTPPYIQLR